MPPRATYRLQFREGMTFARAAEHAPYWRHLGVSHLYASPVFTAAAGSTHGYDAADFSAIDPALGGEEGFRAFRHALGDAGLGLILDFVPNHMSDATDNPWWHDVLEWGAESPFAGHFDIDWTSGPLLRPILGHPYAEALENGALAIDLDVDAARLRLRYFEHALPLTPPCYAGVLEQSDIAQLKALALPFATATPQTVREARARLQEALADLHTADAFSGMLAAWSEDKDFVHAIHEAQHWRLALWRAARDSLNYRRFFEITGLVGVRVEDPTVFDDVHALLLRLVEEGLVDGIRLDHIDGLADPAGYLDRLQTALPRTIPIYVEKILEPGENLPADWPVDGTTGYEFITAIAGGFTSERGLAAMGDAYDAFIGQPSDFEAEIAAAKLQIISENLAAELALLTRLAVALAGRQLATRDYGEDSLRRAIIAMIAAFPVYRTYVNAAGVPDADRDLIERVAERAKTAPDVEDPGTVDFVAAVLGLEVPAEDGADALGFIARFQQTTGPVMAKALEDTVFYRWHRLIALNEVGGDPAPATCGAATFHHAMHHRAATQPHGLSATATHDTKRGEDARARLYTLSEDPAGWAAAVSRWSAMNMSLRVDLDDGRAPEPNTEWMIYQALLGAWPLTLSPDDNAGIQALAARFAAFLEKALREAKDRTRWTATNARYEQAVLAFAAGLFGSPPFLADFAANCGAYWRAGAVNSLSQLLVKLTGPGVPDIYQGTECWDFSLVDPDNRRMVAFDQIETALAGIVDASPSTLLAGWRAGRPKLRLMHAGLAARRVRPKLFAAGGYRALDVHGTRSDHLIAYLRTAGTDAAIVAVPRCPLAMLPPGEGILIPADAWGDTAVTLPEDLSGTRFRDIVTGAAVSAEAGTLPVARLLGDFPVACLLSEGAGRSD